MGKGEFIICSHRLADSAQDAMDALFPGFPDGFVKGASRTAQNSFAGNNVKSRSGLKATDAQYC